MSHILAKITKWPSAVLTLTSSSALHMPSLILILNLTLGCSYAITCHFPRLLIHQLLVILLLVIVPLLPVPQPLFIVLDLILGCLSLCF